MSRSAVLLVLLFTAISVAASVGFAALFQAARAPAGAPSGTTGGRPPGAAEIAERVARLEARLAENPEDGEGWKLLGRSYLAQERYGEAVGAWSQAARLLPRDPEVAGALQRLSEIARERGRHDEAPR